MANKLYNEDSIEAIAQAIRMKNKNENRYTVLQMAEAIKLIETGIDTADGTITPDTVISGYVGYSQGQKITGAYVPSVLVEGRKYRGGSMLMLSVQQPGGGEL